MRSQDGQPSPSYAPSPSPSPHPEVVTFDPTYPAAHHVPRGIGISRFSEDDAFEQNDRRRSDGGLGGEDDEDEQEEQEVAFESVDLDGGDTSATGHLSSDFAQSLRLSSPSPFGLTPTGHALQRSSFAYGSHAEDHGQYEAGMGLQRPVSENGHAPGRTSHSFFNLSRSSTPKPHQPRTSHDSHTSTNPTSPEPTVGRRTPDLKSTATSPTTRPRIHAPPAIPHSLNPSVMAALTSNQYPSTAGSSSPQSTALPSKSSSSAFSLLKRNSLSLTGRGATSSVKSKSSGLEQVRSRTRMVHLPPKDKEEDEAHLERWKHMMEESRSAGKRSSTPIYLSSTGSHLCHFIDRWFPSIRLNRTKTHPRRAQPSGRKGSSSSRMRAHLGRRHPPRGRSCGMEKTSPVG